MESRTDDPPYRPEVLNRFASHGLSDAFLNKIRLAHFVPWLFQQYGIVPDTPAGREQQRTAQRRLQEALHQATALAGESGKP